MFKKLGENLSMMKREHEDIKRTQMEPLEMNNIMSKLKNTLIAV